MNQNDYVILFDENGTPYIAHADISAIKNKVSSIVNNVKTRAKGYQRENHKYYMRIDDPKRTGKYIYFYSKAEYDRYLHADIAVQKAEKIAKANPSARNLMQVEVLKKQRDKYASRDNPTMHSLKNTQKRIKSKYEQMAYSLSKAPKEKYENARKESVQAQRDLAATQRVLNENKSKDDAIFKRRAESLLADRDEAIQAKDFKKADNYQKQYVALIDSHNKARNDPLQTAQKNLTSKQQVEKEAETEYRNTLRGKLDLMRSELYDKRVQREHEKAIAEATSKKAKEEATTDQQYYFRRAANFQNGTKATWNSNKKYSEYSDEALERKVTQALKRDNVESYSGSDSQILQAQATVKGRRKMYEEHSIDLKMAQQRLPDAEEKAKRANEAYEAILDDPTSSKEAYRLAQKLKNTADRELEIAQNDIAYLEKQLTKDNNAYKSAIQVYNTYLHINDRKNK